MQVLDAPKQLHKGKPGICLVVRASLQDCIQKLAASEQLGDEVHLVALFKVLLEEDDILMVHAHENVDLLKDIFPVCQNDASELLTKPQESLPLFGNQSQMSTSCIRAAV